MTFAWPHGSLSIWRPMDCRSTANTPCRWAKIFRSQLVPSASTVSKNRIKMGVASLSAYSATFTDRLSFWPVVGAVLELNPSTSVIRPENPPSEVITAGVKARMPGPKITNVAAATHTTPASNTHDPDRAHHSRSSSSVYRLATPTNRVAERRNTARTPGTAKPTYHSATLETGISDGISASTDQRKNPPSAPVPAITSISTNRQRLKCLNRRNNSAESSQLIK